MKWKLVEQIEETITLRKGLLKIIYGSGRGEFNVPIEDTIVDVKKTGLFNKSIDFKIDYLEDKAYSFIGDILSGPLCKPNPTGNSFKIVPTNKIEHYEIISTHANQGSITLYRKKFKRSIFG